MGIISFIQPNIILEIFPIANNPLVFGMVCWVFGSVFLQFLLLTEINYRRKKEVQELKQSFKDSAKGRGFIQCLGVASECTQLIANRISQAKSVRNTFVGLYDSDNPNIVKSYENWLANPGKETWEDIVGVREFFSGRYASIVAGHAINSHEVYVLRHYMPILNFVILKYSQDVEEVYWGWEPGQRDPEIFRSYETTLINSFKSYFQELKNRTWNQKVNKNKPFFLDFSKVGAERLPGAELGLVNKEGIWITLSYPKRRRRGSSDVRAINRFGLIKFEIDTSEVKVRAKIYESDGTFNGTAGVNHEDDIPRPVIAHYTNNVFVGYQLEGTNSTAVCHYQFRRKDNIDIIQGLYIDRKNGTKNTILGVRLSAEQAPELYNDFKINPDKDRLFKFLNSSVAKISQLNNFENLNQGATFDE